MYEILPSKVHDELLTTALRMCSGMPLSRKFLEQANLELEQVLYKNNCTNWYTYVGLVLIDGQWCAEVRLTQSKDVYEGGKKAVEDRLRHAL